MLSNNLYYYKAKCLKIVDGDTVKLQIDLGFNTFIQTNVRFARINTPELNSSDPILKEKAYVAKNRVGELFTSNNNECIIYSRALDKYGRPIVEIYFDSLNLNDQLLLEGLAEKYE